MHKNTVLSNVVIRLHLSKIWTISRRIHAASLTDHILRYLCKWTRLDPEKSQIGIPIHEIYTLSYTIKM